MKNEKKKTELSRDTRQNGIAFDSSCWMRSQSAQIFFTFILEFFRIVHFAFLIRKLSKKKRDWLRFAQLCIRPSMTDDDWLTHFRDAIIFT